ncbi:MAG: endonuclease MutS2 [Chloroflexota bacterium]|nr:endonuclease MutS2 [Chloroflexota bacterium]
MDTKSASTLELPKILERLAQHCAFSASKELALALTPSSDPAEVMRRLSRTTEAKELLSSKPNTTVGGARDVRPLAGQAAKAAVLQPDELLGVRQTLISGRTLRRLLTRLDNQYPLLARIAERIEPGDALIDAIAQAIDEDGSVRDNASPTLYRLRRELETAHNRLLDKLNRIVADSDNARYLQEAIVTQRAGRYVIPVKVESKGRIPGVVHDQSASGATVFVEPLATLDLNNRWRELEIAEQREVERILRELSGMVGEAEEDIYATVDALAELDLEFAKAEYAFQIKAREPFLADVDERAGTQPYLHLIEARHPLLRADEVVPLDVYLGPDYHVLVITGPNTGGKTVTLKTVGLLALMAQCGMHIPAADGSRLPVFDNIFADIGDEQSIEQSLSTFSSHLANITRILGNATEHSLILLDEVGAGTDPVEGSALARALLEHFLEENISALVATHYSELKVYAHGTEGVRNASVEFDLETLRPTYRLMIGLPGRSNALAIAERLGLPMPIVEHARSFISREELEVDEMLEDIKQSQESARIDRRLAEKDRRESEQIRGELRERIASIEEERRAVINAARQEAQIELDHVREQLQSITRRMERFGGKREELTDIRDLLQRLDSELKPISEIVPRRGDGDGQVADRPIEVGDLVWVPSLDRTGELLGISGDEAEVQAGSFRVRVALDDLELRAPASRSSQPEGARAQRRERRASISLPRVESPGMEIDLRGNTVEEMMPLLDKYIDEAYLSGLPSIRIIHGKGTGTLRRVVRDELRNHPLVKEHRTGEASEGGDGVTVAPLMEQ